MSMWSSIAIVWVIFGSLMSGVSAEADALNLGSLGDLLPFPSQPKSTTSLKLDCGLEQIPSAVKDYAVSCELLLGSFQDLLLSGADTSLLNSLALNDHVAYQKSWDKRNKVEKSTRPFLPVPGSVSTTPKTTATTTTTTKTTSVTQTTTNLPSHSNGNIQPHKAFIPEAGESAEAMQNRLQVCGTLLDFPEVRRKCCLRLAESCPENVLPPSDPNQQGNGGSGIGSGGTTTDPLDFSSLVNQAVGSFFNMLGNIGNTKTK